MKSPFLFETTDDSTTTDRKAHDFKCECTASASVTHCSYGEIVEPCKTDIGSAVGKVGDHHSEQICRPPCVKTISVINFSCCGFTVFLVITPNSLVCG